MLNHRIAITVPSTCEVSQMASTSMIANWVNAVKMRFAEWFGGYTIQNGIGGWKANSGELVEESVVIVQSFTDDDGLVNLPKVRELAAMVANGMSQECVAVTIDNTMEFIEPYSIAA
jgi:hypothetical protein